MSDDVDTHDLETDEEREAVYALRATLEWIGRAFAGEPYLWKWAILAMHNAVQAYMVLALSGSAGIGALNQASKREWLAYLKKGGQQPEKSTLMWPPELFKALQDPRRPGAFGHADTFRPTPTQAAAFEDLNKLRRSFVHYVPTYWIVGTQGFPEMFLGCLDIIAFAGYDSGRISWTDLELRDEGLSLIAACRRLLQAPGHPS